MSSKQRKYRQYLIWYKVWVYFALICEFFERFRDWAHEKSEEAFDAYLQTQPKREPPKQRHVKIEVFHNGQPMLWNGQPFKINQVAYDDRPPFGEINIPVMGVGKTVMVKLTRVGRVAWVSDEEVWIYSSPYATLDEVHRQVDSLSAETFDLTSEGK